MAQACEELQFTLDDRWPFTPIVLEAFKSPSGPAQAARDGQGWPGMALATWRDRWKLWDDLVENTAPTKVEKLKVATDFWLDLTVLSFLEVAIYMMSCMMHVETSQTNSMLAVETDSQCSQCYVHVLSLFLLLIDDSLGDYS